MNRQAWKRRQLFTKKAGANPSKTRSLQDQVIATCNRKIAEAKKQGWHRSAERYERLKRVFLESTFTFDEDGVVYYR